MTNLYASNALKYDLTNPDFDPKTSISDGLNRHLYFADPVFLCIDTTETAKSTFSDMGQIP